VSYAKAVIFDVRLRPASKLGRNLTSTSGFWTYLAIFLGVIYVHTSTNGSPGPGRVLAIILADTEKVQNSVLNSCRRI